MNELNTGYINLDGKTEVEIVRKSCYDDEKGADYNDVVSTTVTGRTCQKWNKKVPHDPYYTPNPLNFPEKSLSAAENYCRNPDGSQAPWCYTTDPDKRWEYCDVPYCDGNIHSQHTT